MKSATEAPYQASNTDVNKALYCFMYMNSSQVCLFDIYVCLNNTEDTL